MLKGEAWREWWTKHHGQNMPMGGYHPMEGHMYDAWNAGYDVAMAQSQTEITHLKGQLMQDNNNDGAYKAAFLAGQMTARGGSWK